MSFPALGTTHDGTDDKEHDINQVMFTIDIRAVSSTRVRCSINVIARASCMETRLDHRRSACSNFINKGLALAMALCTRLSEIGGVPSCWAKKETRSSSIIQRILAHLGRGSAGIWGSWPAAPCADSTLCTLSMWPDPGWDRWRASRAAARWPAGSAASQAAAASRSR